MNNMVEKEGNDARKSGKSLSNNPYYDKDTELAHYWDKGFKSTGRPDVPPQPPVRPVS